MSQGVEQMVANYLTSIENAHDVLLKLGLPLTILYLSLWIIIRTWVSQSGFDSTGFSPAAASALLAPVLLIAYFFVLQAVMQERIADHAALVIGYGALFAPTFLLLVPFGVTSLVKVRQRRKALPNWLLCTVFAAWPIVQVTWALRLLGEWE